MSTTLKALAQIEQKHPRRDSPELQAHPTPPGLARVGAIRWTGFWFSLGKNGDWVKRLGILLLAGAMIVVILVWRWSGKEVITPVPGLHPASSAPARSLTAPAVDPVQSQADENEPFLGQKTANGSLPPTADPMNSQVADGPRSRDPGARMNRSGTAEAQALDRAKPWRGDRIKLQAVVWGPDSQGRMAVVNNRVVQQGAVVEGFTILAIIEGAVIIARNNETWKLVLGR